MYKISLKNDLKYIIEINDISSYIFIDYYDFYRKIKDSMLYKELIENHVIELDISDCFDKNSYLDYELNKSSIRLIKNFITKKNYVSILNLDNNEIPWLYFSEILLTAIGNDLKMVSCNNNKYVLDSIFDVIGELYKFENIGKLTIFTDDKTLTTLLYGSIFNNIEILPISNKLKVEDLIISENFNLIMENFCDHENLPEELVNLIDSFTNYHIDFALAL